MVSFEDYAGKLKHEKLLREASHQRFRMKLYAYRKMATVFTYKERHITTSCNRHSSPLPWSRHSAEHPRVLNFNQTHMKPRRIKAAGQCHALRIYSSLRTASPPPSVHMLVHRHLLVLSLATHHAATFSVTRFHHLL